MAPRTKAARKEKSRDKKDRRGGRRNKTPEDEGPAKPSRYLTPYMLYIKSCWKKHRAEYPNEYTSRDDFLQFSRDCAADWSEMSSREKRHFEKLSAKDKKRYEEEMATYKAAMEKLRKPKRPLGSYFLFCADERAKVREAMPEADVVEQAKELGRRWRKLSANEKAKYEAQAIKSRELYNKQLEDDEEESEANSKEDKGKNKDRRRDRSASRSASGSLSSGDDVSEDDDER